MDMVPALKFAIALIVCGFLIELLLTPVVGVMLDAMDSTPGIGSHDPRIQAILFLIIRLPPIVVLLAAGIRYIMHSQKRSDYA